MSEQRMGPDNSGNLDIILTRLASLEAKVNNLDSRIERLEEKTTLIGRFVDGVVPGIKTVLDGHTDLRRDLNELRAILEEQKIIPPHISVMERKIKEVIERMERIGKVS